MNNGFEFCIRDDPDDSTLGDVLFSVFPNNINKDEVDAIEFVRILSNYQISEALKRGETNINILDVYETPDAEYIKKKGINCPLRFFLGENKDILELKYKSELDHLVHFSNIAYKVLFQRSLCGKYVNSVHNIIDVYQRITPKASKTWNAIRKEYLDVVAPASFWIFKDDYLSARHFCRTANLDNLINIVSEDGFCVDDLEELVLPEPIRKRLLDWLSSVPGIKNDDGFFYNTQKSTDYHTMILSGLKSLSALTIV